MRAYLLYSSSLHFLLLGILFFVSRNAIKAAKEQPYYIDFIGPSKVVTMDKPSAPPGVEKAQPGVETSPAKAAEPSRKAAAAVKKPDDDDFSGAPLPKPSILSSGARLFDPEAPAAAAPGGSQDGSTLITDAANFPYPWYITQVREALWLAWTERMPSAGDMRCTVRFVISRNGAVRGISVDKSSRNRLFDSAAENSVQAAAPFPPLPDDFYEDRLTVYVEFKAMD